MNWYRPGSEKWIDLEFFSNWSIDLTIVKLCLFKQFRHCSPNVPSTSSLAKIPKVFPSWLCLICPMMSSRFFSSSSFRVKNMKFLGAFSLFVCSLSIYRAMIRWNPWNFLMNLFEIVDFLRSSKYNHWILTKNHEDIVHFIAKEPSLMRTIRWPWRRTETEVTNLHRRGFTVSKILFFLTSSNDNCVNRTQSLMIFTGLFISLKMIDQPMKIPTKKTAHYPP